MLSITGSSGPNGATSAYNYDTQARPSQTTTATGQVVKYEYTTSPTNSNGTVSVVMPNAFGIYDKFTFADMSTFQGFILLHELGHQMEKYYKTGRFPSDLDPIANGLNSHNLLNHCFKTNAQGVFY